MKKSICVLSIALGITLLLTACNKESDTIIVPYVTENLSTAEPTIQVSEQPNSKLVNPNYRKYADESNINYDMAELNTVGASYYSKYIDYIAPNKRPIQILAQDEISAEQLLYAYSILSFYLDGKDDIANAVANSESVINMPNGADGDEILPEDALSGQPLYQLETANVGSAWYIENDYDHRDATFEEIFHFVHDLGIGTTQNPQADNITATLFARAMENALPADKSQWGNEGLWGLDSQDWLIELFEEDSLEQEYIASVIDSYYGLWAAFPEEGGMWGIYQPKTRSDVESLDKMGYDALTAFLPPFITSMVRVDPSFTGDFKMYFDENDPYTFKSQYLLNVSLTGSNNNNLYGNDQDNILIGNSGDNIIDGNGGNNIVQFSGESSDYELIDDRGMLIVTDNIKERDGTDSLHNISILRFIDRDIYI